MLNEGDVFAGYTIRGVLGRGGMGSVYSAQHPRLPRLVALKLLNRELFADDEMRARFEREADVVASLDHPSIVTVFDRGVENGQPWISMPYIDGVDAASVDPAGYPPQRAVQITGHIATALDYAHTKGVLHRDVKPANILLANLAGGERVFLTDFGIARLRDDASHLTQAGSVNATIAYASPEQLSGVALDGRADQYSLACTLFWLLTGRTPFQSTNTAAVIASHLQQPPPPIRAIRPDLPPALESVLARGLAKRPEERFASCSEFATAAWQALTVPNFPASPPAAPAVGVGEHTVRSASRKRVVIALCTALVIALAAGIGIAVTVFANSGPSGSAVSTSSAAPKSATDVAWNPCSVSDTDARAAGLNPEKKNPDVGTDKTLGKTGCTWLSDNWYMLEIDSFSGRTFAQSMDLENLQNPKNVTIGGRPAVLFYRPADPDFCTIGFDVPNNPIYFGAGAKISSDQKGDTCAEATRMASVLVKDLPAGK
ncbi:protein kinase [Nocardia sp. CA2R105]|uniref:protein kinase domain-containing protein n=1 Tax=Nocardia coffeae TaxID=2873381 RepID=UPI001CA738AB|nr:protein kinase [Nocardia coffeae]MBY8860317.1 protein kinase [Nocardia coffeae]